MSSITMPQCRLKGLDLKSAEAVEALDSVLNLQNEY